jgi:hypothetical protein
MAQPWLGLLIAWAVVAGVGTFFSGLLGGISYTSTYNDTRRLEHKRNTAIGVTASIFLPFTLLAIVFWAARTTLHAFSGKHPELTELTRKQRRTLEFERRSLENQKELLRVQQEYDALILKDKLI